MMSQHVKIIITFLFFAVAPAAHAKDENVAFTYLLLVVGAVVFILVYFLPSFISFHREHHYKWIILVINVFGSWTGIAWLASLIWAIWPQDKSLADPIMGNVTGTGQRNVGDTLGAVSYGQQRGYHNESKTDRSSHRVEPIISFPSGDDPNTECPKCGFLLRGNPIFCGGCGEKIV